MPRVLPSRPPFARGVSQLMYVGDSDDYQQHQNSRIGKMGYASLVAGALASVVVLNSTGSTRVLAGAAAAASLYTAFWSGIWAV